MNYGNLSLAVVSDSVRRSVKLADVHIPFYERGEVMQCPVCKNVNLVMSDRQGIEIDYCPQCRGVWLDRGELDKIIDRSAAAPQPARADDLREAYPSQDHLHHSYQHEGGQKKKKRGGFLGDLFDFD
jgi:Zn-finger nucleic acid-binding protein